ELYNTVFPAKARKLNNARVSPPEAKAPPHTYDHSPQDVRSPETREYANEDEVVHSHSPPAISFEDETRALDPSHPSFQQHPPSDLWEEETKALPSLLEPDQDEITSPVLSRESLSLQKPATASHATSAPLEPSQPSVQIPLPKEKTRRLQWLILPLLFLMIGLGVFFAPQLYQRWFYPPKTQPQNGSMKDASLKAETQTQILPLKPPKQTSILTFSASSPCPCKLYWRGKAFPITNTPKTLQFPLGKHELIVRKDRPYLRIPIKVYVKKGRITKFHLRVRQGQLQVRVAPWPSKVYLNKQYLGISPIPKTRVYQGFHRLRIEHPKHLKRPLYKW
ncbi:MAG: PEGA domain-containing protein, partial [Myxococcota bacterium]